MRRLQLRASLVISEEVGAGIYFSVTDVRTSFQTPCHILRRLF